MRLSRTVFKILSLIFRKLKRPRYSGHATGAATYSSGTALNVNIVPRFRPSNNNFPNFYLHQQRSLALKYAKMRWRPGLRPDSAGGAHDAPPDPLVGWGGGHPLPYLTLLGAFGTSMLAPAALVFQPEPYHFLKRSGAHGPRPFQGRFVIRRLGLAIFNPHTKCEVSTITYNEEMKGNAKCKNSRFEAPFG